MGCTLFVAEDIPDLEASVFHLLAFPRVEVAKQLDGTGWLRPPVEVFRRKQMVHIRDLALVGRHRRQSRSCQCSAYLLIGHTEPVTQRLISGIVLGIGGPSPIADQAIRLELYQKCIVR